jgi:hypothetical protein
MTVLAFESDPDQAAAIRHIVCGRVRANLTLVPSVGHALEALSTRAPDLVLLSPLVSAREEAELLSFLRALPSGAHVETLITPRLRGEEPSPGRRRWRLFGGARGPARPDDADELGLFAQTLTWSLEHARERRWHLEQGLVQDEADLTAIESVDTSNPASMRSPDRRRHRRFGASELLRFRSVHIERAREVSLVDVSVGGALLEVDSPLRPDSEAILELVGDIGRTFLPFRVLRCQISGLARMPRYLGGCAFVQPLDPADLVTLVPGASTGNAATEVFGGLIEAAARCQPDGPGTAFSRW